MATIRNLLIRISVSENTSKGVRRVTGELQKTNREVDRANKSSGRFGSTLSKLGRTSLGRLTSGLAAITKFTAAAGKGLFFVASAAAALNTASQAGVALAPLAGGLLLIPGAALAAATALGTLKLATSGMGDAFKAALTPGTDPKKLAASMKYLSPAARAVTLELNRLQPTLLRIRNTAQQALFAPLVGQMTALSRVLAGPVRAGVAQIAGQFGLAGRQAAQFARQAATVELVRAAFGQTSVAIHNVLPALQPVLAGFRALGEEGLSFLPLIATSAGQAGARFGVWLQQIVATGRAADWIRNALATFKQLFGVVSQVGGILKSVFSAASAAGSGFIGVIGAALAQLNAFLKTAAGKSALQSIFQALGVIGQTLGPVIGSLVTGLGTLAKPLAQVATLIGPILTTAVTALAPALAALIPGVAALFGGLGTAVELLAPALLPLGKALAQIGVAIGPVLPLVGQLIGQLVSGLAPILGQLLVALSPLLGAIVRLVGVFTPLIAPLAQIILQLVQGLVPVLVRLEPVISQVVSIVGQFLVSGLQMLMTALQPLLPVISQVGAQIGQSLVTVLKALAPALLQVLQALLPLLPSFVAISPAMAKLIVAVTPLIVLLIKLAAVVLRVLLPPIVTVIGWLLRFNAIFYGSTAKAITDMIGLIRRIPGAVVGALSGAGSWLVNVGKNILIGLWNGLVSLSGWLYNRLVGLIKAIVPAPIRWALGIKSPSKVMAELGRFAGMGLAIGLEGTAPHVRRAAGTLATAAVPAMAGFTAPAGVTATSGRAGSGRGAAIDVNALAQAVKSALDGVGVHMDGQPVGQIVSRHLGRSTDQRRRTG
jgi:phage-related protein